MIARKAFIDYSKGYLLLLCAMSAYPAASFMWLVQHGDSAIQIWGQNIDNPKLVWDAVQGMRDNPFNSEYFVESEFLLLSFVATNSTLLALGFEVVVVLIQLLSAIAFGSLIVFAAFVDGGINAALGCVYDVFKKECDR
ncbi:MAG: hypothetical protein ACRCYP_03740 [Alphaproteobacteria bacterium]